MSSNKSMPRVALCGRSNVGKSSLFNRLIGRKKALVLDEPGVTRDVFKAQVNLDKGTIELADLAGLERWAEHRTGLTPDQRKLRELGTQTALEYLKTVDQILFLVDSRQGISPEDHELARKLREYGLPILLILAKAEGKAAEEILSDSVELGFGEGLATSAEHNLGINHLKEELENLFFKNVKLIHKEKKSKKESQKESNEESDETSSHQLKYDELLGTNGKPIRLGVYGRPNVGKSTFVNWILGEGRMITSPIAGTTVDTVDTDFTQNEKHFRIIDTPGIRRKSKTEEGVEVLSVVKALHSLKEIHLALFLIDGYEGITDQDEKIAGEIIKSGKPVVLVVNKWDLCQRKKEAYAEQVRQTLGFMDYAPVLFVSAFKHEGLELLWDLIEEILNARKFVAPTAELNRFLGLLEGVNANTLGVKIYYASQTSNTPPTITCMVNHPQKVHFAFERYIKNELRAKYGWMGSPLKIVFKRHRKKAS